MLILLLKLKFEGNYEEKKEKIMNYCTITVQHIKVVPKIEILFDIFNV